MPLAEEALLAGRELQRVEQRADEVVRGAAPHDLLGLLLHLPLDRAGLFESTARDVRNQQRKHQPQSAGRVDLLAENDRLGARHDTAAPEPLMRSIERGDI